MKAIFKAICFTAVLLVLLKLAQAAIDGLYETYGRRYITSQEE